MYFVDSHAVKMLGKPSLHVSHDRQHPPQAPCCAYYHIAPASGAITTLTGGSSASAEPYGQGGAKPLAVCLFVVVDGVDDDDGAVV